MKPRPFRLERYFDQHEFAVPHVLGAADCETMTIGELLALRPGADDALKSLSLGYTHSGGHPDLRDAIAATYDGLIADDVLVHAAGEEVIFTFMNVALSRGDHVIVHTPCYQSLLELPRAIGCRVTPWEARPDAGWAPDLDFLADHVTDATRAIIVSVPHSPTGFLFDEPSWRALFEIADRVGAIVFADEAYRGLEYDDRDRLPAGCELVEHACSLGLLSKGYGLPGLRTGWAATRDRALLRRMQEMKDYTTICGPAPSEMLAGIAIEHRAEIVARSRVIVRDNLEIARAFFAAHAATFDWIPPRAGSVTFPTLRTGEAPAAFCDRIVRAAGVLLLPGTLFDEASTGVRFGLGRRDFAAGIDALAEGLKSALDSGLEDAATMKP